MLPWSRKSLTFNLARGDGAVVATKVAVAPNLPRTALFKCRRPTRASVAEGAHAAVGRAAGVAVGVDVQDAVERVADLI